MTVSAAAQAGTGTAAALFFSCATRWRTLVAMDAMLKLSGIGTILVRMAGIAAQAASDVIAAWG
jgi:hypothetical protein